MRGRGGRFGLEDKRERVGGGCNGEGGERRTECECGWSGECCRGEMLGSSIMSTESESCEVGLGGAVAEWSRCIVMVGEGVETDFCINGSSGTTTGGGAWKDLVGGMGLETLMGRFWWACEGGGGT
jgi:hypothetical protein